MAKVLQQNTCMHDRKFLAISNSITPQKSLCPPCSKIFVEPLDIDGKQVAYLWMDARCQCVTRALQYHNQVRS